MSLTFFKMNMEDRRKLILEGNVFKTLILLSIPTMMMAIVGALIPFSDGLFLNNIIGPIRVAAITYSGPPINIMLGFSSGLGVAAMAMIGQMAGKGDTEAVKKISLQVLCFSIICGLMLIPVSLIIAKYMASKVDSTISSDVFLYISMYSIIIPLQFLAAIFNAIKNSVGNPEAPFYRMVVLLFLKLFFNYIFLSLLRLEIMGAIYASFSAYVLTAIWMYYDLFIKKYLYRLSFKHFKFDIAIIKELVRIGIPSMLSYMMINLGFLLINNEVMDFGVVVLSGLGIASNINNVCFQLPTSIATSVTTMISINMGNNNVKKAKKSYRAGIIFTTFVSIFMLIILIPNTDIFTRMFTDNKDVLKVANEALKIHTYSILPYGVFMICQSVLNSFGKNNIPLVMSF